MTSIYLHDMNQFACSASYSEKELKARLKQEFDYSVRRASRLTLLALIGVLPFTPQPQCGVYIGSNFNSPSNMHQLHVDVFQHRTPRPFNFINSINNAVSFYVAQAFNITGPNIFIATPHYNWSQIFVPAIVDLQLGVIKQALVGWCHELHRHTSASKQEGSHWLLLSTQKENAIAELIIQDSDHTKEESNITSDDYFYAPVEQLIARIQQRQSDITNIKLLANKAITVRFIP